MKILLIRLSSIGDIVLTTPLIRCLFFQVKDAELHYLCKSSYTEILESNPYLKKIHAFQKNDKLLIENLRAEKFDYIVDLQNNKHSLKLCRHLGVDYATFPKLNIKKWILVNFKINLLPDIHVVDRYFEAVRLLGVINDGKGLEYSISEKDKHNFLKLNLPKEYIAIAVGSNHITKQIPKDKLLYICQKTTLPIVFLGDKNDYETAAFIMHQLEKPSYNLCGEVNLQVSAACVENARCLLTGDTGLMHVGAAFGQRIISVWGNTVPAFGMYPYMPENKDKYVIIEHTCLRCRPCSKLGYKRCPLGHFKCMNDLDVHEIVKYIPKN